MSDFVLMRERWVRKILKMLREDHATGPDELPARILRRCAGIRGRRKPLTWIVRRALAAGLWTDFWRLHRLCPLHQKGVVHSSNNHRALHLTAILSKVFERALDATLSRYFDATNAFGHSQWAFRRRRCCNAVVLYQMCSWLRAFQRRQRVGVFLSDIAGACDRVDSDRLVRKLRRSGLCESLLTFLTSYLAPRTAHVAVDNCLSGPIVFEDMVFQGAVLGPSLWSSRINWMPNQLDAGSNGLQTILPLLRCMLAMRQIMR